MWVGTFGYFFVSKTFTSGRGAIPKGWIDGGGHQVEHPGHGCDGRQEEEEEDRQEEEEWEGGEEGDQGAGNYEWPQKYGELKKF